MSEPRVALVVVSHSRVLARAAVALAGEMLHGRPVRIEVAAGLDETTFGTDAVAIMQALERADGPAGTVVLMDLGSAVLSTELALDLLQDATVRDRVTLSAAPLVEGLVVAAVAAANGVGRAEVAAEARDALLGKSGHLAPVVEPGTPTGPDDDAAAVPDDGVVGVFRVQNLHGLHARPAARLVGEVRSLDAAVHLRNLTTDGAAVPGGSLSRVATLAALRGHEVEVRATGPQAHEAVEHLLTLAARSFDEVETADEVVSDPDPLADPLADPAVEPMARPVSGPRGAAPGIAMGPARRLAVVPLDVDRGPEGDPAAEWRRVVEAVATVRRDVEHLRVLTLRDVGAEQAGIFDAHLALLGDQEMLADVHARTATGVGAVAAWSRCLGEVEREWAGLPDPYLRERAADVRAVADQVLRALTGESARRMTAAGVLVADDLTPAEAAELDPDVVAGVVLAHGSPTSHAAILAGARGIAMVVAAGPAVLDVPEGHTVLLDGSTGELHLDPTPPQVVEHRARAEAEAERRAEQLALADRPARTRDGTLVTVAANLGSVADARAAFASGADGAGLVRTELLFLDRSTPPSAAEQRREYDAIADALHGRPITLRTLDVGGDKPMAYLPVPPEANPFLGLRGIRLSLEHPDLLREQLSAICATARRRPTSIMIPMVSTPEEMVEARRLLVEAAGPSGLPDGLRVGTMIEVPAAALKIEAFLPLVDFVSIGTNDLTQYALAAERGNSAVAALADPLDPGVLRLIDHVCRGARDAIDVAVCGEAAADELAVPVLVGLGVRELSVSPPAVPRVKAAVRELDLDRCEALARQALGLASAAEVRALVGGTCY